jgi:hypothetical protein
LTTTRLPLFSLITLSPMEKCKLLEREFNLDIYRAWIQVSKVLGLATDNICYFAVKNTVSAMLEKNAKDGLVTSLGSARAYQQECPGEHPYLHQHYDQQ